MNRIILFFALSAAFISCSRDEKKEYVEPDNYITAWVNGQQWIPNNNGQYWAPYSLGTASIGYFNGLRGIGIYTFKDSIGIHLKVLDMGAEEYFYPPVTYTEADSTVSPGRYFSFGFMRKSVLDSLQNITYTSRKVTGRMTITSQNIETKKISGTFEFTVIDTMNASQDTLRVTDGAFINLHYVYFP